MRILYLFVLFYDAISSPDYVELNYRIINELETTRNQSVAVQFKVLSPNLSGVTDKDHEVTQSKWKVSGSRLDSGTSRTRSRIANKSATACGEGVAGARFRYL
jgi:hypothetical protein